MTGRSQHILSNFQIALDKLNGELRRMGDLVQRDLELAVKSLSRRETSLADEVIAEDAEIDQLEVDIDREGLEVIVLYQPVAGDLRQVVSAMKVSSNLERIADEAVNIAKRVRRLNKRPELAEAKLVEPAYDLAANLVNESLGSFWRGKVSEALEVKSEDKELNRICKDASKTLIKGMAASPDRVKDLIDLMFVFRSLERVGDHAKNIAEDAVFAEAALDIRHGGKVTYGEEE